MSEERQHHPPAWAQRFVEWYCKPALAEDLMGDLQECFQRNVQSIGPQRARLVYIIDAFKFFRGYTIQRPHVVNILINGMMISSYIKTSSRNILRNKLFSSINMIGLAISMSVGLLLISFVHDLLSYDKYNNKGSRIYRITSHAKFTEGRSDKFATTSLKAGQLIEESVAGVEETVMMRAEFSGDAKISDKQSSIPLTGLYSSPSIFRIFTWPMLLGDPSTALEKSNSIVLTETSARRLFGNIDALGKTIHVDTLDYTVTGILKDLPFFSHLQFESLVSLNTLETRLATSSTLLQWENVWQRNYVYVLLPENSSPSIIQSQLNEICARQNQNSKGAVIDLSLLPLYDIMLGEGLTNSIRPTLPGIMLWIMGGLALMVIMSACFNYTNLSIARFMRRFREVGLRKVIGASASQVRLQFLAEAVFISLIALIISLGLFMLLRPQLISLAPQLQKMVKLEITITMGLLFMAFAVAVGLIAGFLPALFFAKVSIIHALRNVSSGNSVKGLNFRRALVFIQYTLTLVFITSTAIGYIQYKNILAFNLGFTTENILNISLLGNKPEELIDKLNAMPEVVGVSRSKIVTSVGNAWGGFVKFKDSRDSALVLSNIVDENYLPLHEYHFMAGQNFITRPIRKEATSEVIVNEKLLRLFDIGKGDPQKAIGEEIKFSSRLDNKPLTIVGVIKDFHYGKLDEDIKPVVFTYLTPDTFIRPDKQDGLVNVRLQTNSPIETMAKINEVWKSMDPVHPLEARFYQDEIEEAYSELSAMLKVIGFLSFIAISIASLGLLGMVVYTTETRTKEISIRKVLGATAVNLLFLLSRGFLILLASSAIVALPITYYFFEEIVLIRFPFHEPIGALEFFGGFLAVLLIALVMIGSQTMRAVICNPAEVLNNE